MSEPFDRQIPVAARGDITRPAAERAKRAQVVGLIVAGLVLAAVAAIGYAGIRWYEARKRLAAQATLAIDWPEGMRHGATLELNGATKDVPRLGTIQFRCPPGETRILATAPGYRPIELVEELKAGERHSVRFRWRELAAVAKADASEENGGAGGEKSPLQVAG